MGRDKAGEPIMIEIICFNPRAHVGRDLKTCLADSDIIGVSIHAPTWGATPRLAYCVTGDAVSIHAPTWGATFRVQYSFDVWSVSIHAPTWGATCQVNIIILR